MEYSNNHSKQISWQGIFKGIMQQPIDPLKAEDLAYQLNSRLHEMYPMDTSTYSGYPATGANRAIKQQEKQRPSQCPQCGSMAYYNNKGISAKSGLPYENWKCSKCKYIEWKTTTYEQKRAKAYEMKNMATQSDLDELEQQINPNEEYDAYNNPQP